MFFRSVTPKDLNQEVSVSIDHHFISVDWVVGTYLLRVKNLFGDHRCREVNLWCVSTKVFKLGIHEGYKTSGLARDEREGVPCT